MKSGTSGVGCLVASFMLAVVALFLVGLMIEGVSSVEGVVEPGTTTPELVMGDLKAKKVKDPTTNYKVLPRKTKLESTSAICFSNSCWLKTLKCPTECPFRKPRRTGDRSCFIDCSPRCETSCKYRKPKCKKFGAICYDPRFVGGDGVMFYFHGKANNHFCLVSDKDLHINAHFIGIRPPNRARDYTWVQALGIIFGSEQHKLGIFANRASVWDENEDHFSFSFNGSPVNLPLEDGITWSSPSSDVIIERTANTNNIEVKIVGHLKLSINVVPITAQDNKTHNYGIPSDDSFAHLDLQFTFFRLSPLVDGILGQTYRPNFKNPAKVGVPMPILGGEDKFSTSSLFSLDSKASKFGQIVLDDIESPKPNPFITSCTTQEGVGEALGGFACRR